MTAKKRQTAVPGTLGAARTVSKRGDIFTLEPRNCGDATCTKCPHGPYWYMVKGHRRVYVGKELTDEAIDRAKRRN